MYDFFRETGLREKTPWLTLIHKFMFRQYFASREEIVQSEILGKMNYTDI